MDKLNILNSEETKSPLPRQERVTLPLLHSTRQDPEVQSHSQHLFGDLAIHGFAIRWNNSRSTTDNHPLHEDYEPEYLNLYLNLEGRGTMSCAGKGLHFGAMTGFVFGSRTNPVHVEREEKMHHRYLVACIAPSFLEVEVSNWVDALCLPVRQFVDTTAPSACFGELISLDEDHEQLVARLLQPMCMEGLCQLRCKGLFLQLSSQFLFNRCCSDDSSCDRQTCLARERVRNVLSILQRDLITPPSLEAMGREIGCSPFHLSRTFSKETGMTIPQYLRKLRLHHAAELLKSGKCNVTEAATTVGYSSLSHFSQAFCKALGCCPTVYALDTSKQRAEAEEPEFARADNTNVIDKAGANDRT